MNSQAHLVKKLARNKNVFRVQDAVRHGVYRETLRRMAVQGKLQRISRGVYSFPDQPVSENISLAEASLAAPHGVICLLSALAFHGLTTQLPHEIWMAIDARARKPQTTSGVRYHRFSGQAYTEGMDAHQIDGVTVRIYNPAKTVADCWKYRNKIGMDIAMEALKDFRQQYKSRRDELWHYAKICRVANVIRPYSEALAS